MSEWDQRQLCSDGACVGVIGSDGTCKVCGRAAPNWGEERKRGLLPEADASEGDAEDDEDDDYEDDDEYEDDEADDEGNVAAEAAPAADPDWEQRKLCPDEACIGVIGSDGRCKVCHRSAA
ncbi:MAG TPA: hypothetical protein VIV11_03085 [Kofleriaceae bacterium]